MGVLRCVKTYMLPMLIANKYVGQNNSKTGLDPFRRRRAQRASAKAFIRENFECNSPKGSVAFQLTTLSMQPR
jgi:hypothetical protein